MIILESKLPFGPSSGVPLVTVCAALSAFSHVTPVPVVMLNEYGI